MQQFKANMFCGHCGMITEHSITHSPRGQHQECDKCKSANVTMDKSMFAITPAQKEKVEKILAFNMEGPYSSYREIYENLRMMSEITQDRFTGYWNIPYCVLLPYVLEKVEEQEREHGTGN